MGNYTDEYVDELRARLRRQYDELESLSAKLEAEDEELVQALRASEAKDEELAKERDKTSRMQSEEIAKLENLLDRSDETLINTLKAVSVRDIEIERLTFALKDKDDELESVRDEHRTQIDELMRDLDEMRQLFHDSLILRNQEEDEARRLKCKNKKRDAVALLSSIDELWTLVKIHKEDIAGIGKELAVQGEMVASIQRHDGLISKAFGCIDNHSGSIHNQQQSIDALWEYVKSIAAHINTGGTPDGNQD